MATILVTGATGNVGTEVIRYLSEGDQGHHVIAAVRDVASDKQHFTDFPNLDYYHFDFSKPETWGPALAETDYVFLLRPPAMSDVAEDLVPLLDRMKEAGVSGVVLLSVQGADKSKLIPHHKAEVAIRERGIPHVFLRPSYFMQNLTTTLYSDIRDKRKIILPAGTAEFLWVDVANIGEAAAAIFKNFHLHAGQALDITGTERENFYTVAALISRVIPDKIKFYSPNLLHFFWIKKREGVNADMIFVLTLLHYLKRFQARSPISDNYHRLTGKQPTTLEEFISREREKFMPPKGG